MIKLEHEAKQYIEKFELIQQGDRIAVGCSGGIDSIVLLHFLNEYSKRLHFEVVAIHVNHMLRGEEADGDRLFVEEFCRKLQIPLYAINIPIPEIFEEERGNLQDICRRERYNYFLQVMEQNECNKLAVAHHADDQVESILMALVRGSHEQGVLGMPAMREFYTKKIIRPLLSVTREEVEHYLQQYELTFREDASNKKDTYMRNRMRHHVVPLLKKENIKVATSFQHFSEKQREEDLYLNQLAEDALKQCVLETCEDFVKINVISFQKLPLTLQRRAVLLLLKYLYKDTIIAQSYALWNAILSLVKKVDGQNEINLPDGGVARRHYDILEVFRFKPSISREQLVRELPKNEWVSLSNGYKLGVFDSNLFTQVSPEAKYYNLASISLPLSLRTKREGDRMYIKGMTNSKKVSRIFIDAKIPQHSREQWPILVDAEEQIIAIPGLRLSKFLVEAERLIDGVVLIVDLEK